MDIYPADVIAEETRNLGMVRRMVLRWVSPDLSRACRQLARNHHAPVASVTVVDQSKPGWATRWVEANGIR